MGLPDVDVDIDLGAVEEILTIHVLVGRFERPLGCVRRPLRQVLGVSTLL